LIKEGKPLKIHECMLIWGLERGKMGRLERNFGNKESLSWNKYPLKEKY